MDTLKHTWEQTSDGDRPALLADVARNGAANCLEWMFSQISPNDDLVLEVIKVLGDDTCPIIDVVEASSLGGHCAARVMHSMVVERGVIMPSVIKKLAFIVAFDQASIDASIVVTLLEHGCDDCARYIVDMCAPLICVTDLSHALLDGMLTTTATTKDALIKRTNLAIKSLPDWVLMTCAQLTDKLSFYAIVGKMFAEHAWRHEHAAGSAHVAIMDALDGRDSMDYVTLKADGPKKWKVCAVR